MFGSKISIIAGFVCCFLGVGIIWAGVIIPPTEDPEPTFYTLEDIYQKMVDPDYVYETHDLIPIATTTESTMHSLNDIAVQIKALDSSTTTVEAGVYPETPLVDADEDFKASNIKDGVSILGVNGRYSGKYSCNPQ